LDDLTEAIATAVVSGIVDLGAPVLGLEGNGELLAGDPIPALAGTSGSNSAAIRKDDNIWDRYTRIQSVIEK